VFFFRCWFYSIDERAEVFHQEFYYPYLEESASVTSCDPSGEHLPLLPIFYMLCLFLILLAPNYAMLVSSPIPIP